MKNSSRFLTVLIVLASLLPMVLMAQAPASKNVIHPGQLWRDTDGNIINAHGAGFFYERGMYYWFGEFKIAGTAGNTAHVGISCYGSKDLYHWKNLGIALPISRDPSSDIVEGSIMERPKVLHNSRTGQYVMWFHLELKGQGYKAARVGVAVSKKPQGPYTYLRSFRPDGEMSRDLTLFQDEDGSAYLITSSEDNRTMHVSQLTDDFLSTTGRFQRIFVNQVLEAPAIFKYAGKYFFVGSHCTGWAPNPAVSAVADSIFGPWSVLGNPAQGPDADVTFGSQSTYVLPIAGKPGAFVFIADRWNPKDAADGRYVWLPLQFEGNGFVIPWKNSWSLKQRADRK